MESGSELGVEVRGEQIFEVKEVFTFDSTTTLKRLTAQPLEECSRMVFYTIQSNKKNMGAENGLY